MATSESAKTFVKRLRKVEMAQRRLAELAGRVRTQADAVAELIKLANSLVTDTSAAKPSAAARTPASRAAGRGKRATAAAPGKPAPARTTAPASRKSAPARKAAPPARKPAPAARKAAPAARKRTSAPRRAPARPSAPAPELAPLIVTPTVLVPGSVV